MYKKLLLQFMLIQISFAQAFSLKSALEEAHRKALDLQISTKQLEMSSKLTKVERSRKSVNSRISLDGFHAKQADFFLARSVKEGRLAFPGTNLNDPGVNTHSQLAVDFQYPILDKSLKYSYEGAQARAETQTATHNNNSLQLEKTVVRIYLRILKIQASKKALKSSWKRVKEQENQHQLFVKGGSKLKTELLEVQVRLREIEQKLLMLDSDLEENWVDFLSILQLDFDSRFDFRLPELALVQQESATLEQVAFDSRSEVSKIKSQFREIELEKKRVQSRRSLKIKALGSVSSNAADFDLLDGRESWMAGVVLSRELGSGGVISNELEVLEKKKELLELKLRREKLQIRQELERALRKIKVSSRNRNLASLRLNAARENLHLREKQWKGGSIGSQDYLKVEEDYSQAREAMENARIGEFEARVSLVHALGESIKEKIHE